ncbi:MAG: tetratricopeptide repeat protein, partial [Alphaproteobacteria bacterium]|nr:tetratricopeptide repeat protein [Alphaproteobacteria bacterium]
DRVRVNAQLIDATAHRHVWAERFDRQIEDVFELQDDIVASIATAVGPEVTQAEIERAKSKRPGTLDAWDLYLRALAGFHKTTRDDAEEAITLLEQAIKVEPDFASAYALLGLCHSASAMHGWVQPASQGFREARRCAEEALHLAPTSPDINHALAVVLSVSGEPERAITAARRAIDLNPNFPEAFAYLGLSLVFLGRLEEGMAECYHAMRGSPRDTRGSFFYNGLGHGHFMLGEYEKSIEIAQKGQHLDPSNYGYMVTLAASNACLGRQAEAKRHVDTLLRFIPRFTLRALRKNPMFTQPEHIDKLVEAMRLAGVPE